MDLPLSRFRDVSKDQIQSSFSLPSFIFNSSFFTKQKKKLSPGCNFRKKRTPLSIFTCLSLQQGLKPKPKPLRTPNLEPEPQPEPPPIRKSSTFDLCREIENRVLFRKYDEALELFEILECEEDADVRDTTYESLVQACTELRSVRGAKRVYSHMWRTGYEPDQYLSNRVLLMLVRCGMMIDARQAFDEMPEKNLISWNTIIGGLIDSGSIEEAFHLFGIMLRVFSDGCARTFVTMIRAAAIMGFVSEGEQLHACVVKLGIYGDTFVACALISMYSKCGNIQDAQYVFDEMREKTVVAWNSIIAGHALHGFYQEALGLYYEMQESGVKLDNYTYSMVISICARLASVEHAKQAHAGLVRDGFGSDLEANTALIDFYGKWGRIEDARRVFDNMPRKNLMSWNALIAGYGNHGRGIEAIKMFDHMHRSGVIPNHVTFLAVLSACAHSGLSKIGWTIFESMSRDYKIKPRAMHYACMIQLLGREGLLDDALAFINDAPFRPTENMWSALLNACRIHKNLKLGQYAAERLYGMEPGKLSNYVVLLNIYNSSGKLEEAAAVKKTLSKRGLRMLPACSWIEVKKQAHCFHSRDTTHVQYAEIYQRLDGLMQEIAKHGYIPADKLLLPDVDKQEEKVLFYHSEKLAVAFGIMSAPELTSLQVVQSHRICGDCHTVIKLIAKVTRREVVVRDASRFHHFKNGTCSCGDYW